MVSQSERLLEKLLNQYLSPPLFARITEVIDMYDSFCIFQKRSLWFSKEVAEIVTARGGTDFKVVIKDSKWGEQIKTAAKKVTHSSPAIAYNLTVHD